MGTYRVGILGSFSGKVGTVIGSSWNGINYMRSLPRPSSKAATEAQLIVRTKFALAMGFLSPIRPLFEAGYKSAVGQTGANAATSQIISTIAGPDVQSLAITYPQVLISRGSLTGAEGFSATPGVASVEVEWLDNGTTGNASPADKAVTLVYCPALSQYSYDLGGALRSVGTQTITLSPSFTGKTVQVWLGFISADGKKASTSVFVGAKLIG